MRLRSVLAATLFLLVPLTACKADSASHFAEGTDYRVINPPLPTRSGKIEVMEFFFYGCPHCYDLEPSLEEWLRVNGPKVDFVRVPAAFRRTDPDGRPNSWFLMAKAFYAAEVLGVGEKVHPKLFSAIHEERRSLYSEEELAKFFSEQGVPAANFKAAFDSFSVETKVAHAMELAKQADITGVPTLIVDGKYQVLGKRATSYQDYLGIMDYLLTRSHRPR